MTDYYRRTAAAFEAFLSDTTGEDLHVKILTPDEDELLGSALYDHCELNEGIQGDFVTDEEERYQEEKYNRELRELVERMWPIDQER